jgi:hypothetical protein
MLNEKQAMSHPAKAAPICALVECFCGKHPEIKPVGQYMIKCSECRCTMGYTDDVKESYQGGTCKTCWIEMGGK